MNLTSLTEMLKAFQGFRTKDVEEPGRYFGKQMAQGLPMEVNLTLFRKIARLKPEQVQKMEQPVMDRVISLKEALALCDLENSRIKTLVLAGQLLGNWSPEEVMRQYPDSFPDHTLDAFRKAQVAPKGNQLGLDLEEYCQKLTKSKNLSEVEPKVKISPPTNIKLPQKVDVVVITADSPTKEYWNIIKSWLKEVKKVNSSVGVVLVVEDNDGLEEVKQYIRTDLRREPTEIFFQRKNSPVKDSVRKNILYGLVAGKVFNGLLYVLNGELKENLQKIVHCMSPPNPSVVVFPMASKVPLAIAHVEETAHVEYFVTKDDEKKLNSLFSKELMKEDKVTEETQQPEVEVENEVLTSGTVELEESDSEYGSEGQGSDRDLDLGSEAEEQGSDPDLEVTDKEEVQNVMELKWN